MRLSQIEPEDLLLLVEYLRNRRGRPAWLMMRDHEEKRGFKIVPAGSVAWLPSRDWHQHDCVALDGTEVRLVAIAARRPRTGAFKRLLAGVYAAGLTPAIICPFEHMRQILTRWDWVEFNRGETFFDREEIWRPQPGWRPTL